MDDGDTIPLERGAQRGDRNRHVLVGRRRAREVGVRGLVLQLWRRRRVRDDDAAAAGARAPRAARRRSAPPLTDGAGQLPQSYMKKQKSDLWGTNYQTHYVSSTKDSVYIYDQGRIYKTSISGHWNLYNELWKSLYQILKDRTGCSLTGFYISPNRKNHFRRDANHLFAGENLYEMGHTEGADGIFKTMKKDGYVSFIDNWSPGWKVFVNNNQENIDILLQSYKSVKIKIEQVQNGNLFKMPVKIKIDKEDHIIWVEDKEVVFEIPALKRPELVIFNSGLMIPSELTFHKSISEWVLQLETAPHILDRIAAINVLKEKKGRRVVELALLKAAESDPFWGVRREAVYALAAHKSKKYANWRFNC